MERVAARPARTFATLLRQYRMAAGLTQEELAERGDVSPRTISDLERGLTARPYRETVRRLSDALNLQRADRVRFEAAARGFRIAQHESFPADREANPTNLPYELTSFVGRDAELGLLRELLAEEKVRLLTLVGTGGAGKSRLSLRIGRDLLPLFPDGVFVVSLAPLDDPELVLPAIATVLGVKQSVDQTLQDAVAELLQNRDVLLILDNFERLVEAGPTVKRLLEASARLQVVVTSRVPLHLYGEHEFPVSPLAVPDLSNIPPIDELSRWDAVALFVARARAVQLGFALTHDNGASVAAICSHLDGLPLAIELAAGRMKLFSPQGLLHRLQSRLDVLTGGARDLPLRQQTLRHTIDWSYSLLSANDQALFARLSVFAGGWTLEAAETVCNEENDLSLLDGVEHLVDACLVQREGEESRFSMLETIREYATEKLEERGEAQDIARRHAMYFAMVVEEGERPVTGPGQEGWLPELDAEQDNLYAALDWAREHGHVELGLRMAAPLHRYWWQKARFTEGRRLLESLLGMHGDVAPHVRARALLGLGQDAYTQGDFERAREALEESLRLTEEAGDAGLRTMAILDLGVVACNRGDLERGIPLLEQAVTTAREAGNSAALNRSLILLSYGFIMAGEVERGLLLAEEGAARARADGSVRELVSLLDAIARARFELGEIARARNAWREGLQIVRDLGYTYQVPYFLQGLAGVAAHQGDTCRAARLFAAEEEQRVVTAAPRALGERVPRDRDLALAKERVNEETWREAWTEGQAMTVEQAIDYALEGLG